MGLFTESLNTVSISDAFTCAEDCVMVYHFYTVGVVCSTHSKYTSRQTFSEVL